MGSLVLMVAALVRASRVYRRVASVLIVSLIVPYGFNLLYNFDVGPFGRIDLTPFLLVGSCLVLDPLHRVVDANPPAERLLGLPVADAIGRPLAELPPEAAEAARNPGAGGNGCPRSWC